MHPLYEPQKNAVCTGMYSKHIWFSCSFSFEIYTDLLKYITLQNHLFFFNTYIIVMSLTFAFATLCLLCLSTILRWTGADGRFGIVPKTLGQPPARCLTTFVPKFRTWCGKTCAPVPSTCNQLSNVIQCVSAMSSWVQSLSLIWPFMLSDHQVIHKPWHSTFTGTCNLTHTFAFLQSLSSALHLLLPLLTHLCTLSLLGEQPQIQCLQSQSSKSCSSQT
jgi:hypothetical protein